MITNHVNLNHTMTSRLVNSYAKKSGVQSETVIKYWKAMKGTSAKNILSTNGTTLDTMHVQIPIIDTLMKTKRRTGFIVHGEHLKTVYTSNHFSIPLVFDSLIHISQRNRHLRRSESQTVASGSTIHSCGTHSILSSGKRWISMNKNYHLTQKNVTATKTIGIFDVILIVKHCLARRSTLKRT